MKRYIEGAGFNFRTLERPKKDFGIKSKKVGTEWYWHPKRPPNQGTPPTWKMESAWEMQAMAQGNIKIEPERNGNYVDGFSFKIKNGFQIKLVSAQFSVYGTIPRRSSTYELRLKSPDIWNP